jgi:hypothetical protein
MRSLAWKSEIVAGPEFGNVTHDIIPLFLIEARVS